MAKTVTADKQIPFFRYPHLFAQQRDAILEAVTGVMERGAYILQADLTEFEGRLAAFVGAKHAVSATSGTTALELCLRAFGVGPGDEVIVPDFTHPATALCAIAVGATPVLVDVDPRSYNTTADLLAPAITEKTESPR